MYLRHEAGHAINYAFELWRRRDWTQTFGDFRRPYRDVYNPQPVEPRLRPLPAPRGHVPLRAEAPRRGLGRDVRGLAGGRPVAAALPRLAGRARQARVRRPHRRASSAPAAATPATCAWACASPTRRSRRRSPSTSTSATTLDQDLLEYRKDLLEIFPRRPPRARAIAARGLHLAHRRTRSRRRASSSSTRASSSTASSRWIGDSDKRVILRFLRQLQALCTAEHMVVPDSRRTEKLDRADRRRDLAHRRRHPPTELSQGELGRSAVDTRAAMHVYMTCSSRGWRNW